MSETFVYLPCLPEYLTPEAVTKVDISNINDLNRQAGRQPANKLHFYTILQNNDLAYQNTFVYPPLGSKSSGM